MFVARHLFPLSLLPPLRRHIHATVPIPMSRPTQPPISALIRVEASSHASIAGHVDESRTVTQASTPWLALHTLHYRFAHDPPGQHARKWDCAARTTRPAASAADAVVVLALLRLGDGPRVLLVRQFRPPVRAASVELPAGLVDEGEDFERAALRELREETGFEGVVTKVHAPASLSPGMTGETVALVEVEVQGGGKVQALDQGENIEVVSVPLGRLEEALELMRAEGVVVKHAVSTLAVGLRLGAGNLKQG